MPNISPPPVPSTLRDILKDYPEYLQRLQDRLMRMMAKANSGIPLFEQAIWALEGTLSTFMLEASDELDAAIASGDAAAIENAKKKRSAVGTARMNMGGMPDLYAYFNGGAA